jgi:hypothetical protein
MIKSYYNISSVPLEAITIRGCFDDWTYNISILASLHDFFFRNLIHGLASSEKDVESYSAGIEGRFLRY